MADQSVYANARPLWMSLPGINAIIGALDESSDNLSGGNIGVPQEAIAAATQGRYTNPGLGPNAGPQQPATTDVEQFLRDRLMRPNNRSGGGVEGMFAGVDKAGAEERKALLELLSKIQSGRTAKGQLEAQRPTTQIFDATTEDARIRAANPMKPDDKWNLLALPMWKQGEGIVYNPNAAAGAELIQRERLAERKQNEDRIAQLLGFARESVTGKNLNEQEKFNRMLAPIESQIPGAMEVDLTKAMSKQGTELAKAQARAQLAAAKAGSESKVDEVMRYAAKMLRAGDIKQEDFINLEKSLIGLGGKTTTPTYSGDKLYADTLASLQSSKIGGKIAVPPEIAHQVAMGVATGKIDPTNPMAYAEQLYRRGIK